MNKNNYKNAIEQIHATNELKSKTFIKIKEKNNKKIPYVKYLAACAMIIVVFSTGIIYFNNEKNNIEITKIAASNNDLPKFKNIDELKDVLKKNEIITKRNSILEDSAYEDIADYSNSKMQADTNSKNDVTDYSTTNIQVENVDEADIVKTDGNYIYYVSNNKIYIVDAKELNVVSKIENESETEKFSPSEIYVYKNKLVVIGNYTEKEKYTLRDTIQNVIADTSSVKVKTVAKAIVFDIEEKKNPKKLREVSLDGTYIQSRMVGENLYFISSKSIYYYNGLKDYELLPSVRDTAIDEKNRIIDCTDIVYFKDTKSYSYMMIGGFNINNNEEVNVETFFGASSNIYASEKNLYITQTVYTDGYFYNSNKNIIYKFNLNNSQIKLQCKGEVDGNIKNQFSIDEYEGNLRIATTTYSEDDTSNQLYILDENLKEIGKIENLAKGEKIYSVRFIGKTGYIVTFKQIDPLFVIDLSDPTQPEIKGELKIPGYSSYLHPYDENHIIGIGYNTKSNGYGGITNDNMKMSMFDITDLTNPKEIFNVDIGQNYAYSEIINNHKSLFYKKNENLIGFPITYREYNSYKDKNAFIIFKIDLENGFEKYGEIIQSINYRTNIKRAIYIEDILYTLSSSQIISYDLVSITKMQELNLEN